MPSPRDPVQPPNSFALAALRSSAATASGRCASKRGAERGAPRQQPAAAAVRPVGPSCAHKYRRQGGGWLFTPQVAMPLQNSNAVALERRMDLASLFCMIGRHGPAVALAVIAMASVLAAFLIYRTVRGKRRRAAAAAAAADRESQSPGASVKRPGQGPSPEESHTPVASTDVSDEGSSDIKEDADLFQSDLKIRHRRAATTATAAEKKPPPYSPPRSDTQIPDNKHTTSDDTEEMALVQDSYKVAEKYAEEASHNLRGDACTVAEMEAEGAGDCRKGATDDTVKGVIDKVHDNNSYLKEPGLINDESHEEQERVFKAEDMEDKNVTTDKYVSDEKTRQEEENFQCASNNQVCFNQTPSVSKNVDERLQDNKTTPETNSVESKLEEPVIQIEDVPVTCISYGRDEEYEEENHHPDSTDNSNHFSPEKEEKEKDEGEEAEEECGDQQLIPQQDATWSMTSEQEPHLPSSQQDQCDYMTDRLTPPIRDRDWGDDGGLASEVCEEDKDEDRVLTAAEFDTHPPLSDKQKLQTEQKDENGLNQKEGVLPTVADQVKEKMLTSDETVAFGEECDGSSVVLSPTLHCLNEPVKVDYRDDDLSSVNTDAEAQFSGIVDFPDLSLDCQQPQSEVKDEGISPHLDKDKDLTVLVSDLPSVKKDIQFEKTEMCAVVVLAEDSIDPQVPPCFKDQQIGQMVNNETFYETSVAAAPDTVTSDAVNIIAPIMAEKISHPHVSSCHEDQQSVQMINNETFDKSGAGPDTIKNVTASVIGEEKSCPDLPSICQDQKSDQVEINETLDKTRVNSTTDAAVCENVSITTPVMSEEISRPDTLSFSQDQQSRNKEDFSKFTIDAAHVMSEEFNPPTCQTHLPSFEQSELKEKDKDSISSPGVGEESGISSMTVTPDLHDAGNEFDMTTENMVLQVMDCDPLSEERTEARNSLFADDVTIPVIKEDTVGTVCGPHPSHLSQQPQSEDTDRAKYESSAANEDMFGHEVEDNYNRAMEQFMVQIASTMILTDKLQTDVKAVVEVVEIKEKSKGVSIAKKVETETEKEKEEDCEKSEISIMEATMDNNEWITDSNYQVHPWMNLSVTPFAQDHTKTDQLTTEECQHSSSLTDATCMDTDTPPSTEVKQTSTLSLVDESTENNKKVVAVQPMPQNVSVTFRIHYVTHSPYQTVAVTGNQQELGNWKEFIPLESAKDGHWATVVSLPAESHVEWKFVVVDKGVVCRWEECGNRLLETGCGDDLILQKWWGLL
ncbi:uncharacterized protein stbd1 [Xiphias gladius]|uniref:uncharacterized protein stbd1 n=1 Tax=Xiphias gladius TaxID=8245 RepID=UPI001A9A2B83|nr:uncharacterized protein stbd1 [Xiphias gladius]